nr:secreted RxLR effector protein 161-like [Setaria viridis]
MGDYKPCQAPMEEKLKLPKDSTTAKVDATRCRSIMGGLRYLMHMRPDISFAVGYVSRFMEDPQEAHLAAIKHLLHYIVGTTELGITYPRQGGVQLELTGFSDSDMTGDIDGRCSTTGIIFFLRSCPVSWQSQKQKVVALSTCEAEYIAAATTCCQGIWLGRLLLELISEELRTSVLLVDNKSAIALAKNPILHNRSKHIDTKFHFIYDCADGRRIKLEYVETTQQLGDILTKPWGIFGSRS